jgi:hypothetical protein
MNGKTIIATTATTTISSEYHNRPLSLTDYITGDCLNDIDKVIHKVRYLWMETLLCVAVASWCTERKRGGVTSNV